MNARTGTRGRKWWLRPANDYFSGIAEAHGGSTGALVVVHAAATLGGVRRRDTVAARGGGTWRGALTQ